MRSLIRRGSPRPRPAMLARARACCALVAVAYAAVPGSALGAPTGLTVVPVVANATGLSYFKLTATPGQAASPGAVELRNPTGRPIRVALDPVAGETIDTLGSTYAPVQAHGRPPGAAAWVQLAGRRVKVPPRSRLTVPVRVAVPAGAQPGDYLAGVSVEALEQSGQRAKKKGVTIASVVRYAIGVEVSLPGPRRALIRFTGATLQRQPSGLAFLLDARNDGNVILQGVHGRALVTRGSRTVASLALGPGTFVTHSAIAYPVTARGESATPGTVYRVRAYLKYAGGIARLDTLVRFGKTAAAVQKAFEPPGAKGSSGLPGWAIGLLSAAAALGLVGVLALLARRRRGTGGPALPALEAALARSRRDGTPLALIAVAAGAGSGRRALAGAIRERLRNSDTLHPLDGHGFLVIAADTDAATAQVLGADLRRHLERATAGAATVAVQAADPSLAASELLARAGEAVGVGQAAGAGGPIAHPG